MQLTAACEKTIVVKQIYTSCEWPEQPMFFALRSLYSPGLQLNTRPVTANPGGTAYLGSIGKHPEMTEDILHFLACSQVKLIETQNHRGTKTQGSKRKKLRVDVSLCLGDSIFYEVLGFCCRILNYIMFLVKRICILSISPKMAVAQFPGNAGTHSPGRDDVFRCR